MDAVLACPDSERFRKSIGAVTQLDYADVQYTQLVHRSDCQNTVHLDIRASVNIEDLILADYWLIGPDHSSGRCKLNQREAARWNRTQSKQFTQQVWALHMTCRHRNDIFYVGPYNIMS
jgi:hypothetical protein